jgi:hypothetical protein
VNKGILFWAASAVILFLLSLVWFHAGLHRKNLFFTYWLCLGVLLQLMAAWWLAGGRPAWVLALRNGVDRAIYALAVATLVLAVLKFRCPANRALLMGLGAMLALNIFSQHSARTLSVPLQAWLRNIAFVGPASYLLVVFSGARVDRLPLWIAKLEIGNWKLAGRAALGAARAVLTLNS